VPEDERDPMTPDDDAPTADLDVANPTIEVRVIITPPTQETHARWSHHTGGKPVPSRWRATPKGMKRKSSPDSALPRPRQKN